MVFMVQNVAGKSTVCSCIGYSGGWNSPFDTHLCTALAAVCCTGRSVPGNYRDSGNSDRSSCSGLDCSRNCNCLAGSRPWSRCSYCSRHLDCTHLYKTQSDCHSEQKRANKPLQSPEPVNKNRRLSIKLRTRKVTLINPT